jgi:hypothetical protein
VFNRHRHLCQPFPQALVGLQGMQQSMQQIGNRFEDLEKRYEKFQTNTNQDLQTMKELHNSNRGAKVFLEYAQSKNYFEASIIGVGAPDKLDGDRMIRIVIEGDAKDTDGKIITTAEHLKGLYIYFNEYSHDLGNLLVSLLSKDNVVLSCSPGEDISDSTATCRWQNVRFSYGPGKKPFPNIQQ